MDFKGDKEGKIFFSKWLIQNGYYNIQTTTRYTEWDIEAEKGGILYYFELKKRNRKALENEGDSIMEDLKYKRSPNPKRSYLVSFFHDCFTIIPYTDPHQELHCKCQVSQHQHFHVKKILYSYPNLDKYIHKYPVDN